MPQSSGVIQPPLTLFEVLVRENISTQALAEELRPKLPTKQHRLKIVSQLDRCALKGADFELTMPEGIWIAQPLGKTPTGRYRWNLYFQPRSSIAA